MKYQMDMVQDRHAKLLPLFDVDNSTFTPHTLIGLSNKSYARMKDNMIELGDNSIGSCDGTTVEWYHSFIFSSNICTHKIKRAGMPLNGCLKEIKVDDIKGK